LTWAILTDYLSLTLTIYLLSGLLNYDYHHSSEVHVNKTAILPSLDSMYLELVSTLIDMYIRVMGLLICMKTGA